jgi:DNA-binding NarL/FixJ family response regulator
MQAYHIEERRTLSSSPTISVQTRPHRIRILLVDDQTLARRGMRLLLEECQHYWVVGEADSCELAVALARRLRPDVVVMALPANRGEGVQTCQTIISMLPHSTVVLIASRAQQHGLAQLFDSGATAYILKEDDIHALHAAIHAAYRHQDYMSEAFRAVLKSARPQEETEVLSFSGLTRREREVLQHIARGKNNREIAAELSVSVKTVEAHKAHIMRKLKVRSTLQLVCHAVRAHLPERVAGTID